MEGTVSISYESYLNKIDGNRPYEIVNRRTDSNNNDKLWGWYVDVDVDVDVNDFKKTKNQENNRKIYPLYYSTVVPSNKLSDLDTIIHVLDEEKLGQMDRRYKSINTKLVVILFMLGVGTCVIILILVNV